MKLQSRGGAAKLPLNIKISDNFKKHIPAVSKFMMRYDYYKKNGDVINADLIAVNKNNTLIDGYITYLIYKMFDVETVKTVTM